MKAIEGKLYSPYLSRHTDYEIKPGFVIEKSINESWIKSNATISKIRLSPGYRIQTFRELVEEVAIVTLSNKSYEMFYRGQTKDYKDKNGRSVVYPSICRPEKNASGRYKPSIRSKTIIDRYDRLNQLAEAYSKRRAFVRELYYSLFQHYDVFPTPFIDIAQSLRFAATFALSGSEDGYLYVFGLPYPNGSVTYAFDEGIVLIKLQNICPPKAYRPRYQEGYLVGKMPITSTKEAGDNLARRMVAKFHLDNTRGTFWDENFRPMPQEILFPSDDKYASELSMLKPRSL